MKGRESTLIINSMIVHRCAMAICARDRKAVMLSSLSSLKIDQHGWSLVECSCRVSQ